MYSIRNNSISISIDTDDLLVQSNRNEKQIDERVKTRKQNSNHWFLWIVIFLISITLVGCDSSSPQNEATPQFRAL